MPSLIKERGHSLYSPTVGLIVHYRSPSHDTEWEGSRSTVLLGRAVSIFQTEFQLKTNGYFEEAQLHHNLWLVVTQAQIPLHAPHSTIHRSVLVIFSVRLL